MKILDKFDWGETNNFKETTIREIFQDRIYEKFFEVEEGDIVVDFGSTIGDFIWSIKDKNPKHCWAVEPVDSYFETMKKNLMGYPVCFIKAAISPHRSIEIVWDGIKCFPRTISFQDFLLENNIDRIDFFKIDCEAGEYDIFQHQHLDFLKSVRKIVVEFHLRDEMEKLKFRKFRDEILPHFDSFNIMSVDQVDIGWDLQNEHFIEYYNEVVIYIDNRKNEQ
jgi:hypothetical protein